MSYLSSIIKSKSGVLKCSDAEKISDEYLKKSKVKKVHFSDVIEICVETVSCSQMLVDNGSELSDIFEVPLNKRNIKKIQILQTADYLNMEDFQEKYNEGMALQYCHKKLRPRNSAHDFIGSKDFTAPLATMEEVDMFCDESPDSSFNGFEDVYFLSVDKKHQSQVITGFDDSKDHLINEVAKNICESAVKEEVEISKTLNHCDDCHLSNTNDQNLLTYDETLLAHKADALYSNRITLEYPMVSVTATQNEHATVGMFALVDNISDSLLVEVPIKSTTETTSGILSTNAFPAPVEVPRFLTSSERSALITCELQENDENTTFECVLSDADCAVMSAMHETTLFTPLPVASEALRSGEFVTRPESKEIELLFADDPCIPNQLESDKKTELVEDYVILNDSAIVLEGIQDDFVTADEVPDFNEFVLLDQSNIYTTINNKLFNIDALEKLQTAQVTEESVSIDKAMMDSGFGSEETELTLPVNQCLEQHMFMTSPVSQVSVSRASHVNTQPQIEDEFADFKKATLAKIQTSVMNVEKSNDSCCVLQGYMADSIDNPCINLNSGIFQDNFDHANIQCNSELQLAIDCCSYPALGSRDSDSASEYAFKTQMIESSSLPIAKQFHCIFLPNLVWLFRCNYRQWDMDSNHFEGSSIMCKELTKHNKALNRQSGDCNLKMCKTKKSPVLQKHRHTP